MSSQVPVETKDQCRAAVAADLRTMIDLLHDTDPDAELLKHVHEDIRSLNERLAVVSGPRWEPSDGRGRWHHFSVFRGDWNPLAPPMRIRIVKPFDGEPGRVEGLVTIPSACEGPPETAHGGVIAGLLDELLGVAVSTLGEGDAAGVPGVTGRLEIRYRKPTPLDTELRMTATITEDRGWRLTARAEVHADEVRTAEAAALFVRPAMAGGTVSA